MSGRVLVTGAAGFAGQHLVRLLAGHGPVIGWFRPGTEHPDIAGVDWASVELLDQDAVTAAVADAAPAAVYHLAGLPHVGDSWALAEDTLAGNVAGTWTLVEALRQQPTPPPRLLVTSSATVYRPSNDALDEDAPIAPNTPYGTSKVAQERLVLHAWREYGLPVVIARAFNHTGPAQAPAFAAPAFARQFARIEAGLAPPVIKVGNLEARRDLSDVRDVVRAYHAMMTGGQPGAIYNVCSGHAVSMQQVLDGLRAHVARPVSIEQDPARMRPADTPVVLGSCARLTADTGWTVTRTLDSTLADLLEYWRDAARRESA